MDTTQPGSSRRRLRSLGLAIVTSMALLTLPVAGSSPAPDGSFREALEITYTYHRLLADLPAKYQDQPETAWYEFQRLTDEALTAQDEVELHPCFVRWWAHEYMGLELTAMSQQIRAIGDGHQREGDMLERLGTQMWARAMTLLPDAAGACADQAVTDPGEATGPTVD